MTVDPDKLYNLVPVVYRLRDADRGYPLRAMLRVIGEQVDIVEKDISGLYENWFIETCADWLVPYIGTLIGYTPVSMPSSNATGARALARERIMVPRREVANTIRFRRRKGTLAVLDDLAEAVAGWPALAVEFYRRLAWTQNIDYLHLDRGRLVDVRDGDALEQIDTAFDELGHVVDIRRVNSARTQGWSNIPDVGVFIWRIGAYTVTQAPAYNYDEESPNCYLFSALGNDAQLYVNPNDPAADPALPIPITRDAFETHELSETTGQVTSGVPYYYGPGKSLLISTGTPLTPVDVSRIVPADLTDWTYRPTGNQIAVDPVLGRIILPPGQARRPNLVVSYLYGFVAPIGGGEYPRTLVQPANAMRYQVGQGAPFAQIGAALTQWKQDAPQNAVIEIVDSNVYAEPVVVSLAQGQTLELRAASGKRPVIRLLDWQGDAAAVGGMSISGAAQSWFILDGIVVTGHAVQIGGNVSGVAFRHCTLVPGWGLDCNCGPKRPTEPSLEIVEAPLCVTIEHSIVGAIQIERDEVKEDPLTLCISDSIVDATDASRVAIGASGKRCADIHLSLKRVTVVGSVAVEEITLAEDSIFLGTVLACRRQQGCMRFCYIPPGSRTPRRYECQPDLVEQAVADRARAENLSAADRIVLLQAERLRVEPEFDSLRYGTPTYCRLALTCAAEIATGADDESEMGVYHDLYQPQRIASLNQRLSEYTPAGTDAGIIYAS
jgi:hypothetical protein